MTQIRFDGCDLSPRGARTPRPAQRTRAAAVLVAIALVLAACGGGGDRMSKPDYERTVNDAGRSLSQVFGTVEAGSPTANQLAVRVARARKTLERVIATLDGVDPPKAAEQAHRELVDALETLSADVRGLARAAAAGDARGVREARAGLADTARELVTAIQRLQQAGFDINRG